MGTEVLRPQNCLIDRFREPQPSTVFPRRKNGNGYYNNYGYRKPVVRTEKKKLNNKIQNHNQNQSEPSISKPVQITGKVTPTPADGGIVMGQVTILRRGESLDSLNPNIRKEKSKMTSIKKKKAGSGSGDELTVYGTGRLGPEQPDMLPKNIRVGFTPTDVYAGSAFSNSPSPRSLPLPSFFNIINNNNKKQIEIKPFDDSASRDLRRLLRLE